jgi:hypothetical protein
MSVALAPLGFRPCLSFACRVFLFLFPVSEFLMSNCVL